MGEFALGQGVPRFRGSCAAAGRYVDDMVLPRMAFGHVLRAGHAHAQIRINPLGVKGAGEAGCVGALPAVSNAVVNAHLARGIRHVAMPASPERIWRALQTAKRPAGNAPS